MPSNIELLKARDFGEIINDTFTFLKQNFKPLLKNFFIFCGFFLLFTAAATVLQQTKMMGIINNINKPDYQRTYAGASVFANMFSVEMWLTLFFNFLSYVAITVTTLCFIILYKQKGNIAPTTEEMWVYIKFYFLRISLTSILLFLLLMIGFILCILPGFYLATVFALIFPIMIIENSTFGYAFNRSFNLIRDYWWTTFGTLVVIGIIVYFCRLVVALPATILNGVSLFLPGFKNTSLSVVSIIVAVVLTQLAQVFSIIPIITSALCYFNLVEVKEGTGLLGRINNFGNANSDINPTDEQY